jgi:rhodanese-related sulfurtransferase
MDHSQEFLDIVNDAKSRVSETDVAGAVKLVENGAVLIDVREGDEFKMGHAYGARHMGRGVIERDIVHEIPDKSTSIVLYCGGGFRSALAADNLQKMGYTSITSMDGGWAAWKESGEPTDMPIPF